jgi:hypothetical protein
MKQPQFFLDYPFRRSETTRDDEIIAVKSVPEVREDTYNTKILHQLDM